MFNGFDKGTFNFFRNITINNNKRYFNDHKNEYDRFIKQPLIQLYNELNNVMVKIDKQIEFRLQRCISSPYTDARFNRDRPIKEYIYLRYKLYKNEKRDIPGFFFDAGIDIIRFGFQVYNITSAGMEKIRKGLLHDVSGSNKLIMRLNKKGIKQYDCAVFKRDHYPDIEDPLKRALDSKDIKFYKYVSDRKIFLTPGLKNEIEDTFIELKDVYNRIKLWLGY
ncbi:MAG: DUF2461 domain-containing protein [Treponema sp.]|jgi:uncharacterized protein (DUF2461 family)|nr:DUF2461 domain-containing protein [Treponema sp.]